jgi:hypothetical protein
LNVAVDRIDPHRTALMQALILVSFALPAFWLLLLLRGLARFGGRCCWLLLLLPAPFCIGPLVFITVFVDLLAS